MAHVTEKVPEGLGKSIFLFYADSCIYGLFQFLFSRPFLRTDPGQAMSIEGNRTLISNRINQN